MGLPALSVQPSAAVPLGMTRHGAAVPGVLACVHRGAAPELRERLTLFLHPAERARLDAFPSELRWTSFLLGRYAGKRALHALGGGVPPHAVQIASGVFDQPVVRGGHPAAVSLSHVAAAGVAVACEPEHVLGVDVEEVAPDRSDVFDSVMTPAERRAVRSAPGGVGVAATLVWTLKEALSKALRCGLMTPFEVLEVEGFAPHEDGGVGCLFRNFAQYRGRAWVLGGHVLAVVSPKHSHVHIAPGDLDRVRGVLGHEVVARRSTMRC